MRRELHILKSGKSFVATVFALRMSVHDLLGSQLAFACGERFRLDLDCSNASLWVDSAAFDISESEAKQIAEWAGIPMPTPSPSEAGRHD